MYCCKISSERIISTQIKGNNLLGIRLSFRARIFTLVSVLMIFSMTVISIFLLKDLKDNMSEEFRERGLLLAREFSQKVAEGILIEDKEILDKYISQLCGSKDVLYVYIYGESGLKLAQKMSFEGIEDELPPKAKLDDMEIAKLFVDEKKHNDMLDISTPVSYENERIGHIRLGISLKRIREKVNKRILNSSILVVIFISIGLVMCFFFSRSFSKPISQLLEGVKKIGKGDLSHQVKVQNKDEIGELADAFNKMIFQLKEYHDNLEALVKMRTKKIKDTNEQLIQEIAERKRAEEALRDSEEKYRNLFNNAQVGMYRTRISDGKFVEANNALAWMFGYEDRADILESEYFTSENYVDPGIRKNLLAILREHGEFRNFEARLYRKDKSVAWFRYSGRIYPKKGYIEGVAADITEEKRFEEQFRQAQKMESIGTLAGGIAHDFNNILGIILGNTELAMDDIPEWNPACFNLEEIKTASLRAKDVVRQILSFARKTKLEKKPTNIIPIVSESIKLLRSSIPTSIEIRQNIAKDVDTILADPTQINQVLINLCTNAAHAISDGGIIEVTVKNAELDKDTAAKHPESKSGRYINLIVSDTGHGISQEDIDRIFDPYFTTKEVGKGTGMGLAVVHGIVKGHNGFISVKSEPGRRTAFSVFIPVVNKEVVAEAETDEELPSGNERILLIDDEESIVKLGRQRLERLGYKVEATTSPIEALELFRSQPDKFDLAISDLTMPEMTGDNLVNEILNIRPDIPIILCTGFSEKVDEKKAKAIGAADYIEKPLDKHDFAFKVRKVLDEKR